MKTKSFNRLLVLLGVITMCVTQVWGATATLQLSNSQSSPQTKNGVTFTWGGAIVTGSGSGFKSSSHMTITLPAGGKLTGISKTNGSNSWGRDAAISVYAGTNNTGPKIVDIVTGTNSYEITSNNSGTTYYLENATGANAWINSLTITYNLDNDGNVHDHFTIATTGISTNNTYTAFSNKKCTDGTDAVYAGKVAKNSTGGCLQLNGTVTNNIVTTTSGGNIKKITAYWSAGQPNTNNRKLTVYGQNTAYSATQSETAGTKLGDIQFTTGATETSLEVSGDYAYIMIVADGAMYIDELDIAWSAACTNEITITKGAETNGTFTLSKSGTTCIDGGNASVTVNCTPSEHYYVSSVTSIAGGNVTGSGNEWTVSDISASTTINVTFAASPQLAVTWMVNGSAYTTGSPTTSVYHGEKVTDLPTAPADNTLGSCDATKFMGWSKTDLGSTAGQSDPSDLFTTAAASPAIEEATTFYAVFAEGSAGGPEAWTKVTDVAELTAGSTVTLVSSAEVNYNSPGTTTKVTGYVAISTQNTNNWKGVGVTLDGNTLATTTGVQAFTLTATGNASYPWAFSRSEGYIYAAGAGSNNYLKTSVDLVDAAKFSISISDGAATMTANLEGRNTLQVNGSYNSGVSTANPIFTCYASSSTNTKPAIYKLSGGVTYSNYRTVCGATYTVSAVANNGELGGVSVSGKVITATPNECVGYAAPAYTVTSGTASVAQDGNTFTVTPSENCEVTINFAATAEDTYLDNVQGWTASEQYCGSYTVPSIADKTPVTSGSCEEVHYHFIGWTTAEYRNSPTGHITEAGAAMTASGTTYYAVWAKEAE